MESSLTTFDFNNYSQKTFVIIGPSGAGKTEFLISLAEQYNKTFILRNDLMMSREKVLVLIEKALKSKCHILLIDDLFTYLTESDKKEIITKVKKLRIVLVLVTTNMEETLLFEYMLVLRNQKIIAEGSTLILLQEERLLKRLGFSLPFMIDLSLQLKSYDLINKLYIDSDKLVGDLWT